MSGELKVLTEIEMLNKLLTKFSATHLHKDGGLYEKLATIPWKGSTTGWHNAILYRDVAGRLWTTSEHRFNNRFTLIR